MRGLKKWAETRRSQQVSQGWFVGPKKLIGFLVSHIEADHVDPIKI